MGESVLCEAGPNRPRNLIARDRIDTAAGEQGSDMDARTNSLAQLITDIDQSGEWPRASGILKSAQASLSADDLIEVLNHCTRIFTDTALPAHRLSMALIREGRIDEADAAHAIAVARGLGPRPVDTFQRSRSWALRDWEALSSSAPEIAAHTGAAEQSPWLQVALARWIIGERRGSLRAVDRHLELAGNDRDHVLCLTRWLFGFGHPNLARSMLAALHDRQPGLPELDMAETALDVFAPHTQRHVRKEPRLAASPDKTSPDEAAARDWAVKLTRYRQLSIKDRPDPDRLALLESSLLSALRNKTDDALSGIDRFLDQDWPSDITPRVTEIRQTLAAYKNTPPPDRPLLQDIPGEVLLSERGGINRTAVVFTGLADRATGMPIQFLDGVLARQGFQTLILRDYGRCAFSCGIRSLGSTAQETLERLHAILAPRRQEGLIAIGLSGGGYAGLCYGLALGADRLYSFSGGTVARPADMKALGDDRVPVIARLAERRATAHDFTRPFKDILAEWTGPRPAIELYFGAHSDHDRRHAEQLEGMANVRLHPINGHGRHDVLPALFANGFEFRARETAEAGT